MGVRCIKITDGAGPIVSSLSINGDLVVTETISATYTFTDINNDAEGVSTFKWYRADDALGSVQTLIDGATSSTYTLTEADHTKYIAFEVRPFASTGTPITGAPVLSTFHGPVTAYETAPVASFLSVDVMVSGSTTFLQASYFYSDINGDPQGASTFKWYRADDALGTNQTLIAGSTNFFHILTQADQGKYIAYEVTPVSSTGTPNTGVPVLSPYYGPVDID